jgi:hypothetical protein
MRRGEQPNAERWAVFVARGYALAQLIIGLASLYLVFHSARFLLDYAQRAAAEVVPNEQYLASLTIQFQGLTTLLLFALGILLVFLASGMWRYREWARHGTLVAALVAIPVLVVSPLVNWVLRIAQYNHELALQPISVPWAIGALVACAVTVYLFAYRLEIITLYLPRPHFTRVGTRYKESTLPKRR